MSKLIVEFGSLESKKSTPVKRCSKCNAITRADNNNPLKLSYKHMYALLTVLRGQGEKLGWEYRQTVDELRLIGLIHDVKKYTEKQLAALKRRDQKLAQGAVKAMSSGDYKKVLIFARSYAEYDRVKTHTKPALTKEGMKVAQFLKKAAKGEK